VSAFRRPEDSYINVHREVIAGVCVECGAESLARYPVVSERGWELVTKCQSCLCSQHRESWHRLGPVSLLSDGLV